MTRNFDFIILGAGAAGLSLLMRMIDSTHFLNKNILLIDKEPKSKNDRTWCFWENKKGFFEDVIYRKWDQLDFYSDKFSGDLKIHPYQYKMIRGLDFYNYCFQKIHQFPNIEVKYGDVRSVVSDGKQVSIRINDEILTCVNTTVFNSFYKPKDVLQERTVNGQRSTGKDLSLKLLQHFKGWLIETDSPAFNAGRATLMDFRVHQRYGTSFIYVLPISETRALIEYTLFTPQTLYAQQYDFELQDYISKFLGLRNFRIMEEELGIIPMTNKKFHFFENGMYNIGIAGGQTKASTGYTFQFIQKQSQAIVDCLIADQDLSGLSGEPGRFHFYDSVLLQLLLSDGLSGKEIFTRLFEKNNSSKIFKFLDNESSIAEELRLIASLQKVPFLEAAFKLIFR